ncbi:MAG: hypothetical protein IJQ00_09400 [Kiritimatiellae bacterium]|nr:hypothetical protein [Kiritimatiellia bacterium]
MRAVLGSPGFPGLSGLSGISGFSGLSGLSGFPGFPGFSGETGLPTSVWCASTGGLGRARSGIGSRQEIVGCV